MAFQHLIFIGTCIFGLMHKVTSDDPIFPAEGCSHTVDEKCTTAKVYCTTHLSLDVVQNILCRGNDYQLSQFQTEVYLKKYLDNEYNININTNYFDQIYLLDISSNELVDFPRLEMLNLKSFNLSRNHLTQAKLSSNYRLPLLTSLDYSYNNITTVVVLQYEQIFHKLAHLNLSHNYLTVIPDSVFESFTNVVLLDLSYNSINKLNIYTFEGLINLVKLDVSNNRLLDIHFSLLRSKKIEELDLSHNMLTTLKSDDFSKLTDLKTLDLGFNYIVNIEFNVFENLILLSILNMKENNITTLPINLFLGKNLKKFHVEGNRLERLMKGTFEGLTFVAKLDLSEQKLKTLERDTFLGLVDLDTLLLNKNKLTYFSPLSFDGLRNLELLDLSDNYLTKVELSFRDLVALNILLLNNNFIAEFASETLETTNLSQLDVSYNNMTDLNQKGFKNMTNLASFSVHHNPIAGDLKKNSFTGLTSLPSLDISGTSLVALRNGSFQGMKHLTYLNISHAEIGEVEFNTFVNSSAIELIDLSFNKLTEFHVNTQDLPNLDTLILNNNYLSTIFPNYFKNLIHLSVIYLSYNKIQTIHNNAFVDQNDLRFLDVSYNPSLRYDVNQMKDVRSLITLIVSGTKPSTSFENFINATMEELKMSSCNVSNASTLGLRWLPRLTSLTLSHNRLVLLDISVFVNLTNLRTLDLSYNNITFIQPGTFIHNSALNTLNISHNLLTTIPFGVFNGLKYINTIDFSYNSVTELENEKFYQLNTLSVIIADNNKIKSLKTSFVGHISLRKLSIGGNAIPCIEFVEFEKFAKLGSIELTALNKDEVNSENVNGISCNSNNYLNGKTAALSGGIKIDQNKSQDFEKILLNIRDILANTTSVNSIGKHVSQVQPIENNTYSFEKLIITDLFMNISRLFNDENRRTNLLLGSIFTNVSSNSNLIMEKNFESIIKNLESILNVLSKKKAVDRLLNEPKTNATLENVISYVNDWKEELYRNISNNKDMITNLNNELEYLRNKLNESKRNELLTNYKQHDNASSFHNALVKEKDDTKSFVFMEICLSLILVILVGYILYKLYKSKLHIPTGRSYSTRNLPEEMDNSNL